MNFDARPSVGRLPAKFFVCWRNAELAMDGRGGSPTSRPDARPPPGATWLYRYERPDAGQYASSAASRMAN